jgi:hypothetical protein
MKRVVCGCFTWNILEREETCHYTQLLHELGMDIIVVIGEDEI